MRAQIPVAVFTIVVGALETAGGAQELIVQGILRNRTYPLIAGTLGTVAEGFLIATGIAIFGRYRFAALLSTATACVPIPTFLLIGVVTHVAGWPMAAIGNCLPIVLVLITRGATAEFPAVKGD